MAKINKRRRQNMGDGRFKYRLQEIAERLDLTKATLVHILIATAVAVLISYLILGGLIPSKSVVNANVVAITRLQANFNNLTVELATKANQTQLETVNSRLSDVAGQIIVQNGRIGNVESRVSTVEGELLGLNLTEVYLAGTFGNYTLYAKSSETGNFTAKVHLMYSRAFGYNGTYEDAQQYFYSGINWTQGTPSYATVITFNGTAWNLGELWWNIGVFPLTANNETAFNITCAGLNSTYAPDFSYVEIWPVM
jgi:hypothetical protein